MFEIIYLLFSIFSCVCSVFNMSSGNHITCLYNITSLVLYTTFNVIIAGFDIFWPVDQLGRIYWPLQCHWPKIPKGGFCKSSLLLTFSKHFHYNWWDIYDSRIYMCFAAFFVWKISNLPFTFLWKFESFCSEPQIWIHSIHHSHTESVCSYYWDNGMPLTHFI